MFPSTPTSLIKTPARYFISTCASSIVGRSQGAHPAFKIKYLTRLPGKAKGLTL